LRALVRPDSAEVDVTALSEPRPTLADVARAAGVSSATASRVLNGFSRVRPETRRQVQQAIHALGYVRQRAPRARGRQRTGSIAFVVCEERLRLFSDPFFGRLLRGADRELSVAGFQSVVLVVPPAGDGRTPAARYLSGGHVDGALVAGRHARYALDPAGIGVPVVGAGRPAPGEAAEYPYVDADNHGGAASAVRHLLGKGRTRIATVAGPKGTAPGADRLAGYLTAISEAGRFDPGLVAHGDFGPASGEHMTLRLLDRRPGLDAVFVASDTMAVGVLRALRRAGRRVPDDVAVVGFGNSPIARTTDPPLTTVSEPVEALGARSARELLALISGTAGEPRPIVLGTELVLREST
jgi:DNA-binding LacI/PurR family transcriptional regulator